MFESLGSGLQYHDEPADHCYEPHPQPDGDPCRARALRCQRRDSCCYVQSFFDVAHISHPYQDWQVPPRPHQGLHVRVALDATAELCCQGQARQLDQKVAGEGSQAGGVREVPNREEEAL